MNHLSNEICILIFQQLTQRNVFNCLTVCKRWYRLIFHPLFYQTIKIYSFQQWIQFIHTSENLILFQEKPTKYYVYHFYFYFDSNLFLSFIINAMKQYPNLQSIHIIENNSHQQQQQIQKSFYKYNKTILLNQLTYIPIWYKQQFNNNKSKNKRRILSLEYDMLSSSLKNENPFIYLNPTGPKRLIKNHPYYSYLNRLTWMNHRHHQENNNHQHHQENNHHHHHEQILSEYQIKTLMFSTTTIFTFNHLIHLSLHFSSPSPQPSSSTSVLNPSSFLYELDERILESIHQQCPQLEKLSLFHFYMNLSEDYLNNNNNMVMKVVTPAPYLKEFNTSGIIIHPKCFHYLSCKYPQLNSFQFIIHFTKLYMDLNTIYSFAFYQMISRFQLLKKLSITIMNNNNNNDDDHHLENNKKYVFSTHGLLNWLIHYPQQLSHLSCVNNLLPTTTKMIIMLNNNNNNMKNNKGLSFINYLTSLTLNYHDFIDTVTNYLFIHPNTFIVSESMKEINIYIHQSQQQQQKKKNHHHFLMIYDWLDMFPNLYKLILQNIDYLLDDIHVDDHSIPSSSSSSSSSLKLHELIKQRKQQQQQQLLSDNISLYKLKKLEIYNSTIQFKNGWNLFFKRFVHMNEIIFNNIHYHSIFKEDDQHLLLLLSSSSSILNDQQPDAEINLDLPFNLDRFSMIDFYVLFSPSSSSSSSSSSIQYDNRMISSIINTIKVTESLSHKNYTVLAQDTFTGRQCYPSFYYCTLNLTCKYIDEFSFYIKYQ